MYKACDNFQQIYTRHGMGYITYIIPFNRIFVTFQSYEYDTFKAVTTSTVIIEISTCNIITNVLKAYIYRHT